MGKDTEESNCITIMVGLDYHKRRVLYAAFRDFFEYASEYAFRKVTVSNMHSGGPKKR